MYTAFTIPINNIPKILEACKKALAEYEAANEDNMGRTYLWGQGICHVVEQYYGKSFGYSWFYGWRPKDHARAFWFKVPHSVNGWEYNWEHAIKPRIEKLKEIIQDIENYQHDLTTNSRPLGHLVEN